MALKNRIHQLEKRKKKSAAFVLVIVEEGENSESVIDQHLKEIGIEIAEVQYMLVIHKYCKPD